jgi:hypothetical protein
MGIRTLSEAIILQSLEDLSDPRHRMESVEFFSGAGFMICSEMAGLDADCEGKLLRLAMKMNAQERGKTAIRGSSHIRRLPSAAHLPH